MIDEIQRLVDQYVHWVRDRTTLRQIEDWVEISTPFLDRHNDHIVIYARREDGGYLLTDDAYTINDLEMSGCTLDTKKRQDLLKMTLNGFGVQLDGEALTVRAATSTFPAKKHTLLQAMLAVNDMFYMAKPYVESVFFEDVVQWLDLQEIRYAPRVKFTGKTGYDHLFDFVIPKSREQPERLVQTVNRATKESVQQVAFPWVDTQEVRPPGSRLYAILNDTEREVPEPVIDALRSYEIRPIPWSSRGAAREELAA